MKAFAALIPAIIMIFGVGTMFAVLEKDKIMDKYFRQKVSFNEAIEAFKSGHVIYRSGESKKFVSREIKYLGEVKIQYGNFWSDKKFSEGIIFHLEDVLANDWIIEDKKE